MAQPERTPPRVRGLAQVFGAAAHQRRLALACNPSAWMPAMAFAACRHVPCPRGRRMAVRRRRLLGGFCVFSFHGLWFRFADPWAFAGWVLGWYIRFGS